MKRIWKVIVIVALALVLLGGLLIGASCLIGADFGRIQDLFCSANNVSSLGEYFNGIIQTLIGVSP